MRFHLVALALVAAAAGCSEALPGPLEPLDRHVGLSADAMVFTAAPPDDNRPELVPNTIKYSDTSKPNATGRAGSATLTARALVGKDGVTLVEVTTGELETSDTPPGTLSKMKLKGIVDPDADPLFTENFNGLKSGGYFSHEVDGLAAGTMVEIQANIQGIDRNRTGVVTLLETVKMRPDLKARITAPSQAHLSDGVYITATISEINGDVGARAECVLYVEGAEADRASGIWVDAAGTVTCSFSHVFDAAGTYGIAVTAESVTPGDWDTANNSASASIEIISAQQTRMAWATATELWSERETAWGYPELFPNFEHATRQAEHWQEYLVWVQLPEDVTFPLDVDLAERSGDEVVASWSLSNLSVSAPSNCTYHEPGGGHWIYLCDKEDPYGYGDSGRVTYGRRAGAITYYSAAQAWWTGSEIAVYSWNTDESDSSGNVVAWQHDVSPRLTLTVANGTLFVADLRIPLGDTQSRVFSESLCDLTYCRAHTHRESTKEGLSLM